MNFVLLDFGVLKGMRQLPLLQVLFFLLPMGVAQSFGFPDMVGWGWGAFLSF